VEYFPCQFDFSFEGGDKSHAIASSCNHQ